MFATIVDVNEHVQALMADAERSRCARLAHPAHPGHNELLELVASVASAVRSALTPATRGPLSSATE